MLECARCCQTSLVVIDDIHLLELRREADRDANNHLKRLANDLQATFVYAGVGLSHGGFMHEGRVGADAALAQISQRFKRLPVEPLKRSTQKERATWLGVLSGIRTRARAPRSARTGISPTRRTSCGGARRA